MVQQMGAMVLLLQVQCFRMGCRGRGAVLQYELLLWIIVWGTALRGCWSGRVVVVRGCYGVWADKVYSTTGADGLCNERGMATLSNCIGRISDYYWHMKSNKMATAIHERLQYFSQLPFCQ